MNVCKVENFVNVEKEKREKGEKKKELKKQIEAREASDERTTNGATNTRVGSGLVWLHGIEVLGCGMHGEGGQARSPL